MSWLSAFAADAISDMYAVRGFPTYLVLDVDGTIVHRGHSPKAIDKVIADLLEKNKK